MAWWTAKQALEAMEVRPQTLYANVSRGRIRARPDPKDPRRSLYHSEDVQRLAKRQAGRRTVAAVAAQTIGWGDPVLASSVSTVAQGRPWYCGQDAVLLSQAHTLEQVAALLWQTPSVQFDSGASRVAPGKARSSALSAALLALSRRLDHDLPSRGRARALLVSEAMGLVGEVIDAMLGPAHKPGQALHKRMARSWGAPCAEDILRRALVLLADHELNASTFATRVAASTGTPLAAALLAGLATLAGPLHAGATVGAQALIEAARRIGAAGAVREHLAQGQPLACFGHPLYPEGDPRAAALFAHFTPNAIYTQVLEEVGAQIGELPNIDFALCALSDRYGLPGAAPFIIFALARCVGWIAHALEQVETGQLIRPRARYVGPAPDGADAAVEPAMSGPRRGAGPGAWSG